MWERRIVSSWSSAQLKYMIISEGHTTAQAGRERVARSWRRPAAFTIVASLVALVPAALSAQDPVNAGAGPIMLATAIRLAQQNSPQTIGARGTIRANQSAVRAAYGAFLPSITASVGTGRQFTGAGTTTRINQNGERVTIAGNTWTYSNGLSFNAQLFNLDRFPNLRAAKADVATARENTVVESYSVALSVEQQFFNAVAARESEGAARRAARRSTAAAGCIAAARHRGRRDRVRFSTRQDAGTYSAARVDDGPECAARCQRNADPLGGLAHSGVGGHQ